VNFVRCYIYLELSDSVCVEFGRVLQCGDGDTQSLLCTEPMWLSSDEDGQGEDVDPCKMYAKIPFISIKTCCNQSIVVDQLIVNQLVNTTRRQ